VSDTAIKRGRPRSRRRREVELITKRKHKKRVMELLLRK